MEVVDQRERIAVAATNGSPSPIGGRLPSRIPRRTNRRPYGPWRATDRGPRPWGRSRIGRRAAEDAWSARRNPARGGATERAAGSRSLAAASSSALARGRAWPRPDEGRRRDARRRPARLCSAGRAPPPYAAKTAGVETGSRGVTISTAGASPWRSGSGSTNSPRPVTRPLPRRGRTDVDPRQAASAAARAEGARRPTPPGRRRSTRPRSLLPPPSPAGHGNSLREARGEGRRAGRGRRPRWHRGRPRGWRR